jgi:TonB-dependent receptor-like protein
MRSRTSNRVKRLLMIGAFAAHASRLSAQTGHPGPDLGQLTLEELMNMTITTASRTSEGLGEAPARAQVVTAAQIRRRGYRSLSDVLKDLPDFKVDLAGNWDFPAELTVQGVRGAGRVIVLLDGIRVSSPTNEPLPIVAIYPGDDHGGRWARPAHARWVFHRRRERQATKSVHASGRIRHRRKRVRSALPQHQRACLHEPRRVRRHSTEPQADRRGARAQVEVSRGFVVSGFSRTCRR